MSESVEKKRRGFGALSPERLREIASRGGRAAHERGAAHEFTREEAAEAGRKGGAATASKGREHMQAIGRLSAAKKRGEGKPS